MVDRIVGTAELFAKFPFLGRNYDDRNRVFAVPRTRYRIFDRIHEDLKLAEVLTIAHSSQIPPSFWGGWCVGAVPYACLVWSELQRKESVKQRLEWPKRSEKALTGEKHAKLTSLIRSDRPLVEAAGVVQRARRIFRQNSRT